MTEDNTFQVKISDKVLKVQIKDWASQANGSVLVSFGDTEVLATCTMSEKEKDLGFFPLTVDYQEKFYAAGKILGSRFTRRELRPSDEAVCTARLIDRTIRPLFPKSLNREIQIVIICLSWDGENDPDIPALFATSLCLHLSDIPWQGPIAPLRVAKIKNKLLLNPIYSEREEADLNLVLSGVKEKDDFLINMIEAEAQEVSEKEILEATGFGKDFFKTLIKFQEDFGKKFGKTKIILPEIVPDVELEKKVKEFLKNKLEKVSSEKDNQKRSEILANLKEELSQFVEENYPGEEKERQGSKVFEEEYERIFRKNILKDEKRPDGRKPKELRKISCEVGALLRTHGSGFFSRGQTKSLSILTLGAPGDVKLLEGMEFIGKKRFIHHYNFPPYSVGEVKPLRGPGRREIGHGMLAEKALLPVIPEFEKFPYSIRIVSEILSSNGSTSMASVCAATLALMEGGVPIKNPVAGISIGLVTENDKIQNTKYKVLTDIQGPEDHYGDMDFKVAGTQNGITAIQMDVKIRGINDEIFKDAIEAAKQAKLKILEKIKEVLKAPREKLSPFAPKIKTMQINPEKIGEVVGPKGSSINEIIKECEVLSIDIQPSGLIYITAEKEESVQKAIDWIKSITREVTIGEVFQGKVKRILDFGAFVELLPGQTGLVHVSKLVPYRIKTPNDVVKIGDTIPVKVISIDELGRINLSAIEAGFKPNSQQKK